MEETSQNLTVAEPTEPPICHSAAGSSTRRPSSDSSIQSTQSATNCSSLRSVTAADDDAATTTTSTVAATVENDSHSVDDGSDGNDGDDDNDDNDDDDDDAVLGDWKEGYKYAHTLATARIAGLLGVNVQDGLSSADAAARLERDGPNKVEGGKGLSLWKILLRQVSNSLTLVLLITMALSFGIADYIEGGVITAVILLNIVVG